jgi:hypothetical protein
MRFARIFIPAEVPAPQAQAFGDLCNMPTLEVLLPASERDEIG